MNTTNAYISKFLHVYLYYRSYSIHKRLYIVCNHLRFAAYKELSKYTVSAAKLVYIGTGQCTSKTCFLTPIAIMFSKHHVNKTPWPIPIPSEKNFSKMSKFMKYVIPNYFRLQVIGKSIFIKLVRERT